MYFPSSLLQNRQRTGLGQMGEHSPRLPFGIPVRQNTLQIGGPDEVGPELLDVALRIRVLGGVEGLLAELIHDLCAAALIGAFVNTDFHCHLSVSRCLFFLLLTS